MAEILITGLTLPKKGEKVTIELFSDGLWCDYNNNNYHGKAIEVPTHGRLIDADALKETLMKSAYPEQREWYFAEACQFIDEAPTIIEASKGRE